MAILDENAEFCDAQALNTGAAGTYLLGDVMDLGTARDMGNGQPLYLVIQVTTAVDSAADGASVEFVLASDAAAAIATDGTATEHLSTGAVPEATLVDGKRYVFAVPLEGDDYQQYLGILQKTSGEAVTAGAVDIFLTLDPMGWKSYPQAANVTA